MKPTDLRGILQYIPKFREKIFVVSIDGAIVSDENFANLLLDFAVLRSLNIRIVLVHGAASQIAAMALQRNLEPSDLDGTRPGQGQRAFAGYVGGSQTVHREKCQGGIID